MSDRERLIEAMAREMWRLERVIDGFNASDDVWAWMKPAFKTQFIVRATAALDAAMPILGEVTPEMQKVGFDAARNQLHLHDVESAIYIAMIREKLG